MPILQIRWEYQPGAGVAPQSAIDAAIEQNPGVVASVPLRLPGWFGCSVLFREQSRLDEFLRALSGLGNLPSTFSARPFECPPPHALDRPVFVVGAPRSGTTLLYETLAKCPEIWTIGGESHAVIEHNRRLPGEEGNRLNAADASEEMRSVIPALFFSLLRNRQSRLYLEQRSANRQAPIRFLEKTPKNSLRIPFLRALFPDCRIIFLYRDPKENLGSLIDAWESPYFPASYSPERLNGAPWKFLLPPDWTHLIGQPIPHIAATQWRTANEFLLTDLAEIPSDDWYFVRYEQIVADPSKTVRRLCGFAGLTIDEEMEAVLTRPLRVSSSSLRPPSPEKWRRHAAEIDRVWPSIQGVVQRIAQMEVQFLSDLKSPRSQEPGSRLA